VAIGLSMYTVCAVPVQTKPSEVQFAVHKKDPLNDFKSKDAKSVKKFLSDIFGEDKDAKKKAIDMFDAGNFLDLDPMVVAPLGKYIDEHVKGESSRGRGFEREGMESMKEELMKEIRGHIKELVNKNRLMESDDPEKPNTLEETIQLIPCDVKREEVQSLYDAGEMDELKKIVNAYIDSYVTSEHQFNDIFADYKEMMKKKKNGDDDDTSAFEEDMTIES